jgi:hypothetical protein
MLAGLDRPTPDVGRVRSLKEDTSTDAGPMFVMR